MSNFRGFTYRLPNRNEPALETRDRGPLAPYTPQWTSADQPLVHPTSETLKNLGYATGTVGGLALFGRAKFRGRKGWDFYHKVMQGIEEMSPGRVLRTFQVSQALAPFTTPATMHRYISPEALRALRGRWEGWAQLENLRRVIGQDLDALGIFEHGVTFRNGRLYLGQTDQVILRHAFVLESGLGKFGALQRGYLRHLGGKEWLGGSDEVLKAAFSRPIDWQSMTPEQLDVARKRFRHLDPQLGMRRGAFWFGGGQTRRQAIGRFLGGWGTALVERMNQLARAPFEIEPFASIFKKLPIRLGVRPGTGLQTLARLTGKLGIGGALLYGSYSYLDWAARKSEALDETPFSEGITAAIAKAWTESQLAIARAGEAVGAQDYVEWQESFAPRSTSLGALMAFPIMGALTGLGAGYLSRVVKTQKLALSGWGSDAARQIIEREGQIYKTLLKAKTVTPDARELQALENIYRRAGRGFQPPPTGVVESYKPWRQFRRSPFSDIEGEALARAEKSLRGPWGRIAGKVASFGQGKGPLKWAARKLGYMSPSGVKALLGVGVGLGLVLPFLPGALLPDQKSEELEAIYSGRKSVPIRKGRWWEFGRSAYEGENIQYFRPHWYPRMLARGRDKAIYGEDEPSPLEKFYLKNFTYELEKKHYFDRPYPVSGTAFEDVPLIGPILAATIGRLVKPPRLMHTDEWMRAKVDVETPGEPEPESAIEYATTPHRYGYKKAPGELPEGRPISPYSAKGVIGEQAYRMTEMIGLPGFSMGAIKEKLTGEETLFAQERQLESAQRMFGAERAYWDLEIGGGLGSTELFRRLYPHRRREIPLYNPIRNRMPEWLPGPGDRSPDFLHGDPYTKVKEGDIRLPGAGYAAFHPELEGVAPEDYPFIHKYKILADIAPYSSKFKELSEEMKRRRKQKLLSEDDEEIFQTIKEQLKARRKRKTFYPYKFRERAYNTEAEKALAEWNKDQSEQPTKTESILGRYWEMLAHGGDTPLEYLTPMSPYNKLVHVRTAVEEYEAFQVYGTKNAFWGNPWRDFMRPFGSSLQHAIGIEGIPEVVKERRELEEYFDILEYVKNTGLERQARTDGDLKTAQEYAGKRRETLFGINPYTYNYSNLFRSLPRRERDYFNEFVKADLNERERLRAVLPDNEQRLYEARWQLEDVANAKKAMKKGLLTDKQTEEAKAMIDSMYAQKRTEGMPADKQLWVEYLSTRLEGESYADWYRRVYLLAEELEGRPLPGPDWIGWHPMVDMDDIKLKVIQGRKENPIDYDIWPDQERLLARRPEVARGAEALQGTMSTQDVRKMVTDVLTNHNLGGSSVSISPTHGGNRVTLNITQDRREDVAHIGKKYNLN